MKLIPKTLFWRAFWAQMLLMTLLTALIMVFIANKQAEITTQELAALWAPALKDVIADSEAKESSVVRVSKDIQILRKGPPTDALIPRWSARFAWLETALRTQGLHIRGMRVSGTSGNSVVWFEVTGAGIPAQWYGVVGSMEGEDLPRRFFIVLVLAMGLSAALAAVLSHMVAKPARMIAQAVRHQANELAPDAAEPELPKAGALEIISLADSVAETRAARRAMERERQIMLSGISHDIRSPLARIRLAAQLLPNDDDTRELQERICRNVDVIDGLVDGFANYLRADVDELQQTVDIAQLIEDVSTVAGLADNASSDTGTVTIKGNYNLLFRALNNLVDNALRYASPPITINVRNLGNEIAIDVLNEGEPINVTDVSRLIKPFERGQSHRGTPGSGLGLAIAVRVAQRHGGRLELAPRTDRQGTRVTLYLARV